jgi:ribosome-associated protein
MNVTDTIVIPDDELLFSFARSGGPGGQNVNKVSSKAILHWNLTANASLAAEVKERLRRHHAKRITTEGVLVIQGQRFRDQAKNIEDCLEKLRQLIVESLHAPRRDCPVLTPRRKPSNIALREGSRETAREGGEPCPSDPSRFQHPLPASGKRTSSPSASCWC